jgi:hypothetical protein
MSPRAALGRVVWLAAVALTVLACGSKQKDEAQAEAERARAVQAREEEAKKQLAVQQAKEQDEAAREALRGARSDFVATAADSGEARLGAYRKLLQAHEQAKARGVDEPDGTESKEALALIQRLDALDEEEREERAAAPNIPEKPKLEIPEYDGAFQISGPVRRCYKDGVAMQSRGTFYFVKDARCPDRPVLYGFVESSLGQTVTLDFGRDGREAEVVAISDKETAADDRKEHQEAVQNARKEYAAQLAAYNAAVRENASVVATLEKNQKARDSVRRRLLLELDGILRPLVQRLGGGPAPVEEAIPAPAVPAQPVQVDVLPQALPKPAGPSPAPPAPAARAVAPEPPKRDRAACLRQCVARCADDANCERTCASSECR